MQNPRILFVDDDESIRQTLPLILTAEGFAVTTVATVPEAIREINQQAFDILLSDLNISEPGDGFTVVSVMRKVQPNARTYILTGYPDFASALEAIRRQVDDYLIKPADVPTLLKVLRTIPAAPLVHVGGTFGKRASTVIRENIEAIIENWLRECRRDPEFAQISLPRQERIDHLPAVLRQLANRLDKNLEVSDKQVAESASVHGATRRRQGYSIPVIVTESRLLYRVIADTLQKNLVQMDISTIIPDLILISDTLYGMLVESLRAYLSVEQSAA